MADISKIKLSGTDYDIKDSVARQASTENGASITTLTNRLNSQGNTINSINSSVSTLTGKVSTLESSDTAQNSAISNLSTTVAGVSYTAGANSQNIANLSARMDGFTNLPSGSTAGDAELADIRVGFNGKTYASAGTAVREQGEFLLMETTGEGVSNILLPYFAFENGDTYNGISITRTGETYHISGTATVNHFHNIIALKNSLPQGVKAGDEVIFEIVCPVTRSSIGLSLYFTPDGTTWTWYTGFYVEANMIPNMYRVIVPTNAVGMLLRFELIQGVVCDYDFTVKMLAFNGNRTFNEKGALPSGSLNNATNAGYYILPDSNTYTEIPYGNNPPAFLEVIPVSNTILQRYTPWDTNKIYARRTLNTVNNWSDWQEIAGGGSGQTVNNIYQNTYNVSANPTITTDTNNYLAPTGDTSDRTSAIATMLQTTGICRLGAGDYYVSNLVMPDGSTIIGSGNKTRVILGTGDFAIKLGSRCVVKDFSLFGNLNNITPSATVGSKHGVLWQGTYSYDANAPTTSTVENLYIANFTGGGICCDNTGYGTATCIHVTDCFIVRCDSGVYIKYWSEYNKFENVSCKYCYYGCINNGGNNMFANCDFSSNSMALLMDNENGQSPNNSHGSYVGCLFNHSGNNDGYGVQILNCDNGTVFDGCQIFYSKSKLINSDGIIFASCNFGASNCDIEINGGGAILYNGNMFQTVPLISINNNSHVVFVNNYVRSSGAVVSA